MVSKDDEAAAVVRLLRYLEREYRGLRPDPVGGPCPGLVRAESRLRHEMTRALSRAYRAGVLPLPIAEKITAVEDELRSAGRVSLYVDVGIGLASDVVGYVDAVELDRDGEPGGDHLFLRPGSVSLVWPEVFEPLFVAGVVDDGAKIETAFDAQSIVYFVLGYYAEACRLLADWIEENPTGSDASGHYLDQTMLCDSAADVRVRLIILANEVGKFKDEDPGLYQMFQQMDYPEPGPDCSFDPDARVLVWFGQSYSLTPNMAGVVGVLFKAWEQGRPEVSIDQIRRSVDASGLDESLSKVFQRRINNKKTTDPVWGVIESIGKGVYRLADPCDV